MKKIIFSMLAVAALASCVKEQTLETLEPAKIEFSGAFVENATKADPSTTTANISEFSVWGVIDNETGIVLKDETVSKSGANWTYTNTQYWTPNHQYYFSAISGDRSNDQIVIDWASADKTGMSVEGLGTMTFTNVDGTNDVLYSENNSIQTPDMEALQDAPAKVKFQFEHLLSKVQFTFTNGFVNEFNTIVVKNITMDVPQQGKVDLTADFSQKFNWTGHANTTTLEMGDVAEGARVAAGQPASSDNSRLTIPAGADMEYEVEFDVELYMGEVLASSAHKTVKISGYEFVSGHSYNFKATINQDNVDDNPLFPIEFEVEVDEWIEEDIDAGTIANTYVVNSAAELQAILDANTENINILFGSDIEGVVLVPENANRITRINGQGKTFTGTLRINGKSTYADATTVFENINFETSEASKLFENAFIYCRENAADGHNSYRYPDNVTIKNCTFTAPGVLDDEGELAIAGASFWSLDGNLVVEGSTADYMHSMVQLTSSQPSAVAQFDNVTITNSKNGISLGTNRNNTIKNSNISTKYYGVRANGCAANTVILDTEISSKQPVIVRNVTVAGYVLNINEASVLTPATEGDYEVIFTQKSDDKEYVAPAVEFTYNVPAYYKVFPASVGVTVVADAAGLTTALAAKAPTVMLMPGIYEGTFKPSAPVTIKSVYPEDKAVIAGRVNANVDCAFENIKFTVTDASKETYAFTGANYQYPAIVTIYAAATSFEGCEFETSLAKSVSGINYGSHVPGKELTVNNCKFVGDFYAIRTRTLFTITNSEFNTHTTAGTLAAVFTWGNGNSGADKVTFTGNENTSGYETMGTMFSSTTFPYDNIHVNIQGNTGFSAFKDSVNPACTVTGLTYASGSESL